VLRVNQASHNNHELLRQNDYIVWIADDLISSDKYLAVFNTGDSSSTSIDLDLALLGKDSPSYDAYDLWQNTTQTIIKGLQLQVTPHGAKLYRLRARGN